MYISMINRIFLIAVILWVPLSVIGHMMHWSDVLMFIIYCLTIIALAAFMGRATESLAVVAGPRSAELLNATFGNAVELIISIFALKRRSYSGGVCIVNRFCIRKSSSCRRSFILHWGIKI